MKVISSVVTGRAYSAVSCDRSIPAGLDQRGDRHPAAKLTSLDIPEIKKKRRDGMSFKAIAKEHGVSYNAIHQIFQRRSWAHIVEEGDDEIHRGPRFPFADSI